MSPRWLYWPAAIGGAVDWNTYKDGIAIYNPGGTFSLSSYVTPTEIEASTSYETPGRVRELSSPNRFQLRASVGEMSSFAPYVAIEHERSSVRAWFIGQYDGLGTGIYTYVTDSISQGAFHANTNAASPLVIVMLTQDPGDPTGWSAYS